jgi:ankyrin repeat protein
MKRRPGTSAGTSDSSNSDFGLDLDIVNGIDSPFGVFNFRKFSTVSSTSNHENLNSDNSFSNSSSLRSQNDNIIKREAREDSLLRIFDDRKNHQIDELIIAAESGNLVGIQSYIKAELGKNLEKKMNDRDSGFSTKVVHLDGVRGTGGFSLLHYAASRGHIHIVAELLANSDISIDSRNDNNETPLHLAVYNGHMLTTEQLISNNANINARNSEQKTPLFYAASRSMPLMVQLLLQRNADMTLLDDLGELAEDHSGNKRTASAFEKFSTRNMKQTMKNPLLNSTILVDILSYLPVNDVCRCSMVDTFWHGASMNSKIWSSRSCQRWQYALSNSIDAEMPASASNLLKSKKNFNSKSSV